MSNYGGARHHGHGGGGSHRGSGRGGRSGGGRGRGGDKSLPHPSKVAVQTNNFELRLVPSQSPRWSMYLIEISQVAYRLELDENGEKILDEHQKPKRTRTTIASEKINERLNDSSDTLSRRIEMQLTRDLWEKHGKLFLADGQATGYSPEPLFETKEHEYEVKIKKGCDGDDPNRDRVPNLNYLVRLTEQDPIHPSVPQSKQDTVEAKKMTQALQIIFNNVLIATMMCSGKSPKTFYLKDSVQAESPALLGSLQREYYGGNNKKTLAPSVGLQLAVRFGDGGHLFVKADTNVGWWHRSSYPSDLNGNIPLLQEQNGTWTLAGVLIRDIDSPIKDERTKEAIKTALKRRTFHVSYYIKSTEMDEARRTRMRSKGVSEHEIEEKIKKMKQVYKMSLTMITPSGKDKDSKPICWSANNEDEYTFSLVRRGAKTDGVKQEAEEEPKYTVASYFEARYGIILRFPHLPIVFTKEGYFPVELLLQAQEKVFGENDQAKIDAVLKFNDEFSAAGRIQHIKNVLHRLLSQEYMPGLTLTNVLGRFGIKVSPEPETFEAVVLKEPQLKFRNKDCRIENGSWSLNGVTFPSPATLFTYAVLDLSPPGKKNNLANYIRDLFETMKKHGMKIPSEHVWKELTVTRPEDFWSNPQELYYLFNQVLTKARKHYLEREFCFQTSVLCDGEITNVLVVRDREGHYLVTPKWPTHCIENPSNQKTADARIKFKVDGHWLDPLDVATMGDMLDVNAGEHFEVGYEIVTQGRVIPESEVRNATAKLRVKSSQIEVPSMVFVYLPSDSTDTYNFVKFLSHFVFGVNSQCSVHPKYSSQRSPGQYCSNIALKVNTKLFSKENKARAWLTFFEPEGSIRKLQEGIPWVSEVSTLVIGLAMSHGIGQSGITVVCASVCLDKGCMQMAQELRIQEKSDIVDRSIMFDIVKSLAIQYYQHTGEKPFRVLIYRDGASEGSFDSIIATEVKAVRCALYELNSLTKGFSCCGAPECKSGGCIACTQPITYIALQSDHNVRIVPKSEEWKNVPSGTVVDSLVTSFQNGLRLSIPNTTPKHAHVFPNTTENGSDFLLTAQGGLKGTSKPMYYRVLLNENISWRHLDCPSDATSLTRARLEKLTYQMAFQYGTATKAPRKIPVVLYGERLANMAISWLPYLSPEEERKLLKAFCPFNKDCPLSKQSPFHPHITA